MRVGESCGRESPATAIRYKATEIEFVECVEGKPYSRATPCDMVNRWTGGDNGRGKHIKSYR